MGHSPKEGKGRGAVTTARRRDALLLCVKGSMIVWGYDDGFLVNCGAVDSSGRPPSGSGRSDGRLGDLQSTCRLQVDPLFRLPTTWRPPLSPLSCFLRRRRPLFSSVKPEYRQTPFDLSRAPAAYRPASSFFVNSPLSALSSTQKLLWFWPLARHSYFRLHGRPPKRVPFGPAPLPLLPSFSRTHVLIRFLRTLYSSTCLSPNPYAVR